MVVPAISVSADSLEESFGDTIEIDVDVTHPVPVTLAVFSASIVMMRLDQHGVAIRGIHDHLLETMGAVETVLCNRMRDEGRTRIEIERQLDSVHESYREDREDFKKIKNFMTSQFGYRP
nr:hypothetical protein [Tanacetum cinerariifolium]